MKAIVADEPEPVEKPFPKLMICFESGLIVLMASPKNGVVVGKPTDIYHIGQYSEIWYMNNFTDFTGSVTLSND